MRSLALPTLALAAGLLLAGCGTTPGTSPHTSRGPAYSRLSAEQASDIAIHALGLVGTPYRYGGNTPDGGFDCSGLIGYVYKSRAGVAPPRTVAQLSGFGQPVDQDALRTGDLVVFGRGRPTHAGIYVGQAASCMRHRQAARCAWMTCMPATGPGRTRASAGRDLLALICGPSQAGGQ